VYKWNWD
jgi:hypothetical protein